MMTRNEGRTARGDGMTYLCVSGVCVKDITKEFTRHCDTRNDQTMDIIRVNNKSSADCIFAEF